MKTETTNDNKGKDFNNNTPPAVQLTDLSVEREVFEDPAEVGSSRDERGVGIQFPVTSPTSKM